MKLSNWLLADLRPSHAAHSSPEKQHPWWSVMCLTGVDYFSTLGYQPGIAILAAGLLAPLATVILVAVTLLCALPVYKQVAQKSSRGQGSIAMLERLLPEWKGKALVLILLGFATTDFVITITLSAADAAAHLVQNPFVPPWMRSQIGLTLLVLLILAAIFLKGFKEAIGVAVVLVAAYLLLNSVVTGVALWHLYLQPNLVSKYFHSLFAQIPNPLAMLGVSLLLFPKLALGLSGFETGVAVMPLIYGKDDAERIANTRRLLTSAALIMSVFLLLTSIATTLLIDPAKFKSGGEASGRALAYLAHLYLGNYFGTLYDCSTVAILAFAGASALAGLLNLIPKYLPRFGMAPEWALASRPLVLVFLCIAFLVTFAFHANVDAQGGAYATGVLVLITSAALAVTITFWSSKLRIAYCLITAVFVYTTILNIYERPEGLKIATVFVAAIVLTSLISRAIRSTELRITSVELHSSALELLAEDEDQIIHVVARKFQSDSEADLDRADEQTRICHNLPPSERVFFLEICRGDVSAFQDKLEVYGRRVGRHAVLQATSPVVANALAAILIEIEKRTGRTPHAYFQWRGGNPIGNLLQFLFLGGGDTAPLTHEVIRRAIKDPHRRPVVHVS